MIICVTAESVGWLLIQLLLNYTITLVMTLQTFYGSFLNPALSIFLTVVIFFSVSQSFLLLSYQTVCQTSL